MMEVRQLISFWIPQKFDIRDVLNMQPGATIEQIHFQLYNAPGGYFYECEVCSKEGKSCGSRAFENIVKVIPSDILEHLQLHVDIRHAHKLW